MRDDENNNKSSWDLYERKMYKAFGIITFLKKHKKKVFVACIILAVIICTLLGIKGILLGNLECDNVWTYGEAPGCNIKAIFATPSYEYKKTVDGEWVGHYPEAPGRYYVRAVSKNILGIRYYSEERVFELKKRQITVTPKERQIYYRDEYKYANKDIAIENIAAGDYIGKAQFSYEELFYEYNKDHPYKVEAGLEELVISNPRGSDVTGCYDIVYGDFSIFFLSRQLTIETGSAEKIYDGKPLECNEWKITEGELYDGDNIEVIFPSVERAGEDLNTVSIIITDASGKDVTYQYEIANKPGILKVLKRPLKIVSGSAEKIYDGKPLTCDEWSADTDALLSGHTLECKTTGEITVAGEAINTVEVKITQGDYDRTKNYDVQLEPGMLRVLPMKITVTSGSAEKKYDGTALEHHSIEPEYILQDHEIIAGFTGMQTEVGSSDNTFYIMQINTPAKENRVDCFEITKEYGTLTVLPNPDFVPSEPDKPAETLPGNDPSLPVYVEFPDTEAENYESVVATIRNQKLDSNNSVYLRSMSYGDYNKRGWDKAAGYPFTDSETNPLNYIGLLCRDKGLKGTTFTIDPEEGVGLMAPYYTAGIEGTTGVFGDDTRLFCNDSDLYYYTESYVVNELVDLLKFNPGNSYETDRYRTFVYDEYLDVPEDTKEILLKIAKQNGIDKDSETLIADIRDYVKGAATNNGNARYPSNVDDIALFFLTNAKEGVAPHFATAATLMYRVHGIPARYTTGYFVSGVGPETVSVKVKNAHAWVEIYCDGLGWVPIEVTGYGPGGNVIDPNGGSEEGEGDTPLIDFTVIPEVPEDEEHPMIDGKYILGIMPFSMEKYYDGTPFEKWEYSQYHVKAGGLLPGHNMVVKMKAENYDNVLPGSSEVFIDSVTVYDEYGNDVSEQYCIFKASANMTILKRPITIATESAEKEYDGQPLTAGGWWIAEGSLAPNDRLEVEVTGSVTVVGRRTNKASAVIYTEDDKGQWKESDCYEIKYRCGVLKVSSPD